MDAARYNPFCRMQKVKTFRQRTACAPGSREGTRDPARRAARNAKNTPVTGYIFE
jgi:hypothetical protein